MRRREFPTVPPATQSNPETDHARAQMDLFVGPEKAKRKPRKASTRGQVSGVDRAMREAHERIESGETWVGASPRLLVGLYAVFHEQVYGVKPEELAKAWVPAVAAAKRLVDEIGEVGVVAFLRFTWKGERTAEKKSEGSGVVRRRVGWYLQFAHRALFVDYKRALLAHRKVAK